MKTVATLTILLVACGGEPYEPENNNNNLNEQGIVLVLLVGDENAVGLNLSSQIDATDLYSPANVELWVNGEPTDTLADGLTYGPEVAMAHRLADVMPERMVIVSKTAKARASIQGAWWPLYDEERLDEGHDNEHLYPLIMKHADAAVGDRPIAAVVLVFVHGEHDSRWPETAAAYSTNLLVFLVGLELDMGMNYSVIVALPSDLNFRVHEAPVREAHLAAYDENTWVLDGNWYELGFEGVNYTPDGIKDLGTGIGSAIGIGVSDLLE